MKFQLSIKPASSHTNKQMKSVAMENKLVFVLLLCILHFSGYEANALSYDYTASIECLEIPGKPQYGGGIIVNPELNDGLKGWNVFGGAKIEHREFGGNIYMVARGRNQPTDTFSQKLVLKKDMLYSLSAWIRVSEGKASVAAVVKTETGYQHGGAIVADSKCWSMLKGGFPSHASGPALLYFECNNTAVELWVDSLSLQPFTQQEWISHQDQTIAKIRKGNVRIRAVDKQGNPLPNAKISIQLKRPGFPIGCAINRNILTNTAYQNWFTSRFRFTTFEDEMKWYTTEGGSPGHEDYSAPDALLDFAKKHGIAVRGHNVVWDDPNYQPRWIYPLPPAALSKAVEKRIDSVMSRYKGQLIAWDVVNENLHFSFFESKLGKDASALFYKLAHAADPTVPLFLNDYNTIEDSRDGDSSPAKYLEKLREIQAFPGNKNISLAIGLEGHFKTPNLPYVRASIDTLAATGLPIWVTELDVESSPNQAMYFEQLLREAYGHPKVQGIVIWSAWKPQGCYKMCLTDNGFKNLPTGDVVDKLLQQWGSMAAVPGSANSDGFFEASLFHGDYEVNITHPASLAQSSTIVSTNASQPSPVIFQVSV